MNDSEFLKEKKMIQLCILKKQTILDKMYDRRIEDDRFGKDIWQYFLNPMQQFFIQKQINKL